MYCIRARVAVSPHYPLGTPLPQREVGVNGRRRVRAGKEGLYFLPFRLKFSARRTARVIGRDLFKRENYPEGVVEHRRFNSRLYGKRTTGGDGNRGEET